MAEGRFPPNPPAALDRASQLRPLYVATRVLGTTRYLLEKGTSFLPLDADPSPSPILAMS
jgi:hypothetical protein